MDVERQAEAPSSALSGWQVWSRHGTVPGMTTSPNPYRGFRFPAEVIEHAVWLYHCFSGVGACVDGPLGARGLLHDLTSGAMAVMCPACDTAR